MPWYYINEAGSEPEGPFVFNELARRYQAKTINDDTYVWHGKRVKEWTKISGVKSLPQKLARMGDGNGGSKGSTMDFVTKPTEPVNRAKKPINQERREEAGISRSRSIRNSEPRARTQRANSANKAAETKRPSLVNKIQSEGDVDQLRRRTSSPRRSMSRDEVSERMVQIANLLCKTQDELEKKKNDIQTLQTERHEQLTRILDLETKLKNEMADKEYLRKQWKKAQREYESEIKQYQAQLDIFFAAETELNNDVFSDEQSIQINLSYVE